jgi:hypothetical protein
MPAMAAGHQRSVRGGATEGMASATTSTATVAPAPRTGKRLLVSGRVGANGNQQRFGACRIEFGACALERRMVQVIAAWVPLPRACGVVCGGAGDDQRLHDDQSARHAARYPIPAGSVADPLVRLERNAPTSRSHRMSDARAGASDGMRDGVRSARRGIRPSIHGDPITSSGHEAISAPRRLRAPRGAVLPSRRQVVGDDVFAHLAAASGIRSSVAWFRDAPARCPPTRRRLAGRLVQVDASSAQLISTAA